MVKRADVHNTQEATSCSRTAGPRTRRSAGCRARNHAGGAAAARARRPHQVLRHRRRRALASPRGSLVPHKDQTWPASCRRQSLGRLARQAATRSAGNLGGDMIATAAASCSSTSTHGRALRSSATRRRRDRRPPRAALRAVRHERAPRGRAALEGDRRARAGTHRTGLQASRSYAGWPWRAARQHALRRGRHATSTSSRHRVAASVTAIRTTWSRSSEGGAADLRLLHHRARVRFSRRSARSLPRGSRASSSSRAARGGGGGVAAAKIVTGRHEVLGWGGFHGKTGGVLGLLGSDSSTTGPFLPGQHLTPYATAIAAR